MQMIRMVIKEAGEAHVLPWLVLREKLWPPEAADDFTEEIKHILDDDIRTAFLAFDHNTVIAFIEISIHNFADGCVTKNVGYIEGIYVEPAFRRRGIARRLMKAADEWFISRGCKEVASDAHTDNLLSIRMHESLGFEVLKPVVHFVKKLDPQQ